MREQYAIFTWRDTGPIKSWQSMRGAQIHNSREKPIEHAEDPDARPIHLIGSPRLVEEARARLAAHGIDPDQLRKNGVIAFEAVITASPEFFAAGSEEEQTERLVAWAKAQRAYVLKRFGAHRVLSLVLHVDEMTPHAHLVVLPLERKPDGHWSLVGRMVSGLGRYAAQQTDYAAAMAPFGLVRGREGSGRKHRPTRQFLDELEAEKAEAKKAKEAANEREAQLRAAIGRHHALLAEQGRLLEDMRGERALAAKERRAAQQERADLADERDQLDKVFGALERTLERGMRMIEALKGVSEADLPPAARAVLRSVMGLQEAARTVALPNNDLAVETQAAFLRKAGLAR